jgi:hypothetical protein
VPIKIVREYFNSLLNNSPSIKPAMPNSRVNRNNSGCPAIFVTIPTIRIVTKQTFKPLLRPNLLE